MRIENNQRAIEEGDMTPMIDMVFLLIAFFMVVINFSEADQNQRIHLPASDLAEKPEAPPSSTLTLQVTEQGTVIFSAQEVALPSLQELLAREVRFLDLMNVTPEETTIVVRGDADVQAGVVGEVIQMCRDLGFEKYRLRARAEKSQLSRAS